jgi:hypothetical protein
MFWRVTVPSSSGSSSLRQTHPEGECTVALHIRSYSPKNKALHPWQLESSALQFITTDEMTKPFTFKTDTTIKLETGPYFVFRPQNKLQTSSTVCILLPPKHKHKTVQIWHTPTQLPTVCPMLIMYCCSHGNIYILVTRLHASSWYQGEEASW